VADLRFAVNWDYRCPFARNAHEHVIAALGAGADWTVDYLGFSLNQVHLEEGEPDAWDDPKRAPALLAMEVGIAVRDAFADAFPAVHLALFAARHDDGRDIREGDVLADVLAAHGLDPAAVFDEVSSGRPRARLRAEHERTVAEHGTFGVPTFFAGDRAVFVRFMHRPDGDPEVARRTIERTIDLVAGWNDLNEFKQTRIPR
jgi:hypothetical protein